MIHHECRQPPEGTIQTGIPPDYIIGNGVAFYVWIDLHLKVLKRIGWRETIAMYLQHLDLSFSLHLKQAEKNTRTETYKSSLDNDGFLFEKNRLSCKGGTHAEFIGHSN